MLDCMHMASERMPKGYDIKTVDFCQSLAVILFARRVVPATNFTIFCSLGEEHTMARGTYSPTLSNNPRASRIYANRNL